MTKLKTSPPSPQPKHFQLSRDGVTTNEGVFSPWKGQSPLKDCPAFLRGTDSPITSTMSSLDLISAVTPTDTLPPGRPIGGGPRAPERPSPACPVGGRNLCRRVNS